ncbi:MAG: hypothetical protein DRI46_09785 [Chloroflexi bacterium]|nr:MAG: hypothetical protein DRI46_09785 [Chloroflexota bacterium]
MIQEIINLGRRTAIVTRYSQAHLSRPENVLEHTGFVCLFCMIVGSRHPSVDMGELMKKAVVHDLEESMIGDVANPVKYANKEIHTALENIGRIAITEIAHDVGFNSLPGIWARSKDETIEGRIVKIADVVSVLGKIYEEVVLYKNHSIVDYAENTMRFFVDRLEWEQDDVLKSVLIEAHTINQDILNRRSEHGDL